VHRRPTARLIIHAKRPRPRRDRFRRGAATSILLTTLPDRFRSLRRPPHPPGRTISSGRRPGLRRRFPPGCPVGTGPGCEGTQWKGHSTEYPARESSGAVNALDTLFKGSDPVNRFAVEECCGPHASSAVWCLKRTLVGANPVNSTSEVAVEQTTSSVIRSRSRESGARRGLRRGIRSDGESAGETGTAEPPL
jgi:hypothetical protein